MELTSVSFDNGEPIPTRFTCDGTNVAPQLAWSDLPPDTQSLAVWCFDPDAPGGTFTHWLLWDIDPSLTELPEGHAFRGPPRPERIRTARLRRSMPASGPWPAPLPLPALRTAILPRPRRGRHVRELHDRVGGARNRPNRARRSLPTPLTIAPVLPATTVGE
jgi:hypothetical protein